MVTDSQVITGNVPATSMEEAYHLAGRDGRDKP
jgi:hypothetical protein